MKLIRSVITARREKKIGEGTWESSDEADDNSGMFGAFSLNCYSVFFSKMFHAYPARTNKFTKDLFGKNVLIWMLRNIEVVLEGKRIMRKQKCSQNRIQIKSHFTEYSRLQLHNSAMRLIYWGSRLQTARHCPPPGHRTGCSSLPNMAVIWQWNGYWTGKRFSYFTTNKLIKFFLMNFLFSYHIPLHIHEHSFL